MITAKLPGNGPVQVSIAVGPEGTCAYTINAGDTNLAFTAPDATSFEQALTKRLAEVGVPNQKTPRRPRQ